MGKEQEFGSIDEKDAIWAEEDPRTASEAFSRILESVGTGGRWQWRLYLLTAFSGTFTALHNLGAVFLGGEPEHWCSTKHLVTNTSDPLEDMRPAYIPWNDAHGRYSRCQIYTQKHENDGPSLTSLQNHSALYTTNAPSADVSYCTEWEFARNIYTETVVSEWNLVCSDRWLMSSIQSTYMIGFMAGALLISQLADKYGRRTMLLISAVSYSTFTLLTHFSVNYLMFICSRFMVAAFGSGIYLSGFVILMESLGNHHRTKFGVMFHLFFKIGIMILAVLGYFFRDWRSLQLATSLPTIILIVLYYYLVPESPRWLMMEGREEEALALLKRIADYNQGRVPPTAKVQECIGLFRQEKTGSKSWVQKCMALGEDIVTLVATPNMRRRCVTIFYAWFTVSMIYYGLAFNGNNLKLPPYLMIFTSGMVELCSIPFNIWIMNKLGRRKSLAVLLITGGISCLAIIFLPTDIRMLTLFMMCSGRFFISCCFAVVFVYSAELVPTRVRNVAVGASSMWARVGSFGAPYIVDMLGDVHYAIPSTVFGLFAISSGLFSLLLPETGGKDLPEDVKEIEAMER